MISASGPAKHPLWEFMGQYDFHKIGPNARTVYKGPRELYFFLNEDGHWSVSSNIYIHILA